MKMSDYIEQGFIIHTAASAKMKIAKKYPDAAFLTSILAAVGNKVLIDRYLFTLDLQRKLEANKIDYKVEKFTTIFVDGDSKYEKLKFQTLEIKGEGLELLKDSIMGFIKIEVCPEKEEDLHKIAAIISQGQGCAIYKFWATDSQLTAIKKGISSIYEVKF